MKRDMGLINSFSMYVGLCWYRFIVLRFVLVFRLGLKSFEKDVSGAVMDIQADEEEGMRQAKSLKKWYKQHWVIVNLESSSFLCIPCRWGSTTRDWKGVAMRERAWERDNECFHRMARWPYWSPTLPTKKWNDSHVSVLSQSSESWISWYVNTFFCSNKFAWLLPSWVKNPITP